MKETKNEAQILNILKWITRVVSRLRRRVLSYDKVKFHQGLLLILALTEKYVVHKSSEIRITGSKLLIEIIQIVKLDCKSIIEDPR